MSSLDLYFIQCDVGGPIKVGVSKHVPARLEQLQAACPYRLNLIGMKAASSYDEEAAIKSRFKGAFLWGEWIEPTSELLAIVSNHPPPPFFVENWRFERDLMRAVAECRPRTYKGRLVRPALYPHPESQEMQGAA